MPHATHASARNQDRDERLVELLHLNSRMEVHAVVTLCITLLSQPKRCCQRCSICGFFTPNLVGKWSKIGGFLGGNLWFPPQCYQTLGLLETHAQWTSCGYHWRRIHCNSVCFGDLLNWSFCFLQVWRLSKDGFLIEVCQATKWRIIIIWLVYLVILCYL